MEDGKRTTLDVDQERAILAGVLFANGEFDPNDPMGELRSLTDSAGAIVCDELLQNRQKPVAKTFMGKGKVQELAGLVKAHDASVVIFENDLSPSQIGNIEEIVEVKVLDRSELILDIFASRAKTYESRLQVELAQLEYTYPRLRAMWSHLERIGGGSPGGIGTRGPGEQQLEVDRRIVQHRKSELKREIVKVQSRKTREVEQRNKENFTVGLVGYTNAGKSTLFNTLTAAGTYAHDKLFATLSTLTRKWDLGGGDAAMLSDTVGFVRDLPHHLVASFKSTLEEAVNADVLLLVHDASHPRAHQQMQTVMTVLDDIGATKPQRVMLLNKTDLIEHNADLLVFEAQYPDALAISAKTGEGLEKLVERIRKGVHGKARTLVMQLPITEGKAISFLETRTTVIERDYIDQFVQYKITIGTRQMDQLKSSGAKFEIMD